MQLKDQNKETVCQHCFVRATFRTNAAKHRKMCHGIKMNARFFACLNIGGKFICQMGCHGAAFDNKVCLYKHFWQDHSAEELYHWGINLAVLENEFGQSTYNFDNERTYEG